VLCLGGLSPPKPHVAAGLHDENLKCFLNATKKRNIIFNERKCTYVTDSLKLLGFHVSNGVLQPDPDRVKPPGAHAGGLRGLEPPLNGNRLNTNLLLTFVKTQNNSADAYIPI